MWSTPSRIKLSRFCCPIAVRPGGPHVTHSGFKPYSRHVITCHVLSLPPETGIRQSYPVVLAFAFSTTARKSRSRAVQSIAAFCEVAAQLHLPFESNRIFG